MSGPPNVRRDGGQRLAELFEALVADLVRPCGFDLCPDGGDRVGGLLAPWRQADGLDAPVVTVGDALNVACRLQVIDERAHGLAIERPDIFAGERIEAASDAPTAEEAAAALSGLLSREFTARQLPSADVPPGLAALFAWLERNPSPVDIGALHGRFPQVSWHRFGDWARQQRDRLAGVSGSAPGASQPVRGAGHEAGVNEP